MTELLNELDASKTRARSMIWEREPGEETVRRLEAAGLNSLVYEICANVPEEGDFLATMRRNLAALESASAPRVLAQR